jgi:hypothetical protein
MARRIMARRIMARRIMCGALEFDQESARSEEVTFGPMVAQNRSA